MSVKEYSAEELKLIGKIDFKMIENDNGITVIDTEETSQSIYTNKLLFAIQDAFIQGVKIARKSEREKCEKEHKRLILERAKAVNKLTKSLAYKEGYQKALADVRKEGYEQLQFVNNKHKGAYAVFLDLIIDKLEKKAGKS
ncbi:MAG TPA: hypothetical protein VMV77_03825 [Bacteroidales bacterium]|nr:hypothetical protein [Bacteroidales bacterium]